MGLAWCRERIEQAQNSKSPVDRILVRCSNAIKPKTPYSHSQGKVVNEFVFKGMRNKDLGISPPVPIHAVPPRARPRIQRSSDWQTCTLTVPDTVDGSKPPVPPPRKKRKRKLNSMEVLNHELPELHSPGYVIRSENLLSRQFSEETDANDADVLQPLEKSFHRGGDRFVKSSGSRARKIKTESHPIEVKEKRVKSDNEKRTEQKIKHVSTVSLPNYNELIKPSRKVSTDGENGDDKTGNQSMGLKHPRRNSSTISLPGEGSNSILSSLSEATIHRLEAYMKRCRSFGALKPHQLLEKLEEFQKSRSASESSDSWSGLDDWDLGVIEWCDSERQAPPLAPKSRIPSKQSKTPVSNGEPKQVQFEEEIKEIPPKEIPPAPKEEDRQTGGKPTIQRLDSVIEGVPLEWFFDPSLRPLAIMPPPEVLPESQKCANTPPPSPENGEESQKDEEEQQEEHSSLLNILRQYKDDESGEPEVEVNLNEIDLDDLDDPGKDILIFDEVDVKIPLADTLNPFLPLKNRSNSLAEDPVKGLLEEKVRKRSPSTCFETSAHLLEQLESNKEEIEKEILLKPEELIQGLRRESLCQSLPEDAFEAYVYKRKPSLRESLNDFLGFRDEKKPDDENVGEASEEKANNNRYLNDDKKDKEDDGKPPPPANPPPVVINPPAEEEGGTVPHSLVKTQEHLGRQLPPVPSTDLQSQDSSRMSSGIPPPPTAIERSRFIKVQKDEVLSMISY